MRSLPERTGGFAAIFHQCFSTGRALSEANVPVTEKGLSAEGRMPNSLFPLNGGKSLGKDAAMFALPANKCAEGAGSLAARASLSDPEGTWQIPKDCRGSVQEKLERLSAEGRMPNSLFPLNGGKSLGKDATCVPCRNAPAASPRFSINAFPPGGH